MDSSKSFEYKTVIKDITTSITNCPQRPLIQTQKSSFYPSTENYAYTTTSLKPRYNTEWNPEPNAGHNATVNQYFFDPSLTTIKKPIRKDKIEFTKPIVDEAIYETDTLKSENLIVNLTKDLEDLQKANNQSKRTVKKKKEKSEYITQEDIQKQKEELFSNLPGLNAKELEKRKKGREELERYLKLNEGLREDQMMKISMAEEDYRNVLLNEEEEQEENSKKISRVNYVQNKRTRCEKIYRPGYMEPKPIDEEDEKYIKKYAKYFYIKKILAEQINFNTIANPTEETEIGYTYSQTNTIKVSNNFTFVAFIKMLFTMLDKERKGIITKEEILNELYLDDRIIQDLSFIDTNQFKDILNAYIPENKAQNELDERDFCKVLLSQCDFKDEVLEPSIPNTDYIQKSTKRTRRRKKDDTNQVEISEDSDTDLPGLSSYANELVKAKNEKEKLDIINKMLQDSEELRKKTTYYSIEKPKKIKIQLLNNQIRIKYNEYLSFIRRYQRKDQINFTIPKPFEFLKKDYTVKKLNKLKSIVEERVEKEDELINHKFHAIKLKEGIWGNKMQNMIEEEMKQRLERQEKLKEKIVSEMKPFTFYDEDERKYKEKLQRECQPPTFPPFRANAIKWRSQVNILDDMQKQEEKEREERKKARIEIIMKTSKLPPRMQQHYEEKMKREKEQEEIEKKLQKEKRSKSSFIALSPPNFTVLQKKFERELEKKKKKNKNDNHKKAIPFNFSEPKKKKLELRDYLDKENNPKAKNPKIKNDINDIIKKMQRKPKLEPSTTKSLNLLMEARRKELEEKQRQKDQLDFEEKIRKGKQERLKERVQYSKAIVDNKRQLEENKRKMQEDFMNELQRKKETYELEKQRRLQKVYNQPLLFEQVGTKGEKFSLNKNTRDELNDLVSEQVEMEGDEEEEAEEGEAEGEGEGEAEGESEGEGKEETHSNK